MKVNRTFVEDSDEGLVMAIKNREEQELIDRFQEYWKERCNNPMFLSHRHVLSILMNFAGNNFKRADWFQYNEYFRFYNIIENNDSVSILSLINAYLTTILLMQMVYDI